MIYYIFKSQIFTVFLSMSHLTAVSFPSKISDYVGGQEGDFKIYELNKGKSLVFESKRKGFSRNFISFLKDQKFHFNVTYDESRSNKDIEIREAKPCSYYSLLRDSKKYQLFECPKSLYFVNKSKQVVMIGELSVKDKTFISKGPPIFLNGKLIYENGRAL